MWLTTHQARHCSPSATATVVRTPIHEQAHAALHGPRFVCQRRCWQTFGLAAQQALKPDTRRNLSYRRYREYPQWPMCPRRRQCHRTGSNGLQAVRVKGVLRGARNIQQSKPMTVIRFSSDHPLRAMCATHDTQDPTHELLGPGDVELCNIVISAHAQGGNVHSTT